MKVIEVQPLVSIIITSFNRAELIGRAIESALSQDYPNLEIIISDNCSTDETYDVVSKYFSDSRIKFFQNEENIGMWGNFEKAFYERSKGDYLLNISSDDFLINSSFISEAINRVLKYPDVSIVWGNNNTIFKKKNRIVKNPMPNKSSLEFRSGIDVFLDYKRYHYWFGAGACLIDLNKARLSRKVYDIDLNLFLLLEGNACFIQKPSYAFIIHDSNATNSYKMDHYLEELNCYEELYAQAIIKYPSSQKELKSWKNRVLYGTILSLLKMLIIRDKNLYQDFYKIVSEKYPNEIKKTKLSLNLFLRKIYKSCSALIN